MRLGKIATVCVCLSLALQACGEVVSGKDGETHFIACDQDQECERIVPGAVCIDGVCRAPEPIVGGTAGAGATGGASEPAVFTGGTANAGVTDEAGSGPQASTGAAAGAGGLLTDTNPRAAECTVPSGWEQSTTQDGQLTFAPSETWSGYIVAPAWPVPLSGDVTLYVETRSDVAITGAFQFDQGVLPAPATDPLTGYLPADRYTYGYPGNSYDNLRVPDIWPGFAFTLHEGTIGASRVQFDVVSSEQWRTWCELVAAYPNGLCVETVSGASWFECSDPEVMCEVCEMGGVRYECGKYWLCSQRICACNSCGCTASIETGALQFDLRLENNGSELNGVIIADGETYQVFLTREP